MKTMCPPGYHHNGFVAIVPMSALCFSKQANSVFPNNLL